MAANTQPIFTLTPHVSGVKIGTTSAQVKSDGTTSGAGTDLMYCVMATTTNGTLVKKVRFSTVASAAATNSVATVLRVYWSTVSTSEGAAAGATTSSNTFLIAEISVPLISSSNSLTGTNYYDVVIDMVFPASRYIMVSQHIAQTTNQQWQAVADGGDF